MKLLAAALPLLLLPFAHPAAAPAAARFTLGWYPAQSETFTASELATLAHDGAKPSVVNYYSGWGEPLHTSMVKAAHRDGVTMFVEMEPGGAHPPALSAIAAGKYDPYLRQFGKQVKAAGVPIWATFAHEMNGSWYPWGDGGSEHASPAAWIRAWNHVTSVISSQAPGLIRWVWAPNASPHIADYWASGGVRVRNVSIAGLDAYLCISQTSGTCAQDYAGAIAPWAAAVRAVTRLPLMITETGIGGTRGRRGSELAAEVAAVHRAGLTGLLYFDQGHWALTAGEEKILAGAVRAAAG